MKRLITLMALAMVATGCTALDAADYAVTRYCGLPVEARLANREAVAVAVAPNRIEIECNE